jgi:hypothetical protein
VHGEPEHTMTLRNRTLGIIGLGRIGKTIARRAEAFDVPVVYHGRSAQKDVDYRFYPDLVAMARDVDIIAQGCNEGQGYLYSKPLPARELTGYLKQARRLNIAANPATL